MASASGCTPTLSRPDAQRTGKSVPARTVRASPWSSSSCDSVPVSKNRAISVSSVSATVSIRASRAAAAAGDEVVGTGPVVQAPEPSVANVCACRVSRSITPVKARSSPMGIWTGTQLRDSVARTASTVRSRLPRSRSSRWHTMIRGSWSSRAVSQIFSVETWTPATASTTTTAASTARNAARASLRKFPAPGVSMRFNFVPRHSQNDCEAESVCLRAIASSS